MISDLMWWWFEGLLRLPLCCFSQTEYQKTPKRQWTVQSLDGQYTFKQMVVSSIASESRRFWNRIKDTNVVENRVNKHRVTRCVRLDRSSRFCLHIDQTHSTALTEHTFSLIPQIPRDGTHTMRSLAIFEPPPPSWFYLVYRKNLPSPPKKEHLALLKKWAFTGRLFTSQKNTGYHFYLVYFIKEIRYNDNQYESRTGKELVIANEEMGRQGPRRDAHLKTPLWAMSYHGFSNSQKKTSWFLVGPPRLPHRGLTWFYKEPSPLPS